MGKNRLENDRKVLKWATNSGKGLKRLEKDKIGRERVKKSWKKAKIDWKWVKNP